MVRRLSGSRFALESTSRSNRMLGRPARRANAPQGERELAELLERVSVLATATYTHPFMAKRKHVPSDVEVRVLEKSKRRCCLCFSLDGDFKEKEGQIAHLDRNPA